MLPSQHKSHIRVGVKPGKTLLTPIHSLDPKVYLLLLCRLLGDYIGRLPVMSIGLIISAVSYLLIGPIPLLQVAWHTHPALS